MSFYTYILRCSNGKYYVGHTDDLERRIAQHQAGEVPGYTQKHSPVEYLWSAEFDTRAEAIEVELQLKGWRQAKKEALIRGDWQAVRALARKSFDTPLRQAQRLLRTNGEGEVKPDASLGGVPRLRSGRTGEAGQSGESAPFSIISMTTQDEREGGQASHRASTPPPAIVLVRPQLGENIGKAARAMLNFGLAEMRLVAPRDGWPNPSAGPAASGADVVLANAQVFDSVADAVADCAHVYATTVRKRGVTKPVVAPDVAAEAIHAGPGKAAILFGPERSGLETDDVALARTILTVPINPQFGSLNLAQAVILVAYEWSKHVALASPPAVELDPPAPQEEFEGMFGQLDAMLERAGFYFPPDRVPATRRTLRSLLTKPGWNSLELRTLRGVLSALEGKKRRR